EDIQTNITEDPGIYQSVSSHIYPGEVDPEFWRASGTVTILHDYPGSVQPDASNSKLVHNSVMGSIRLPGIESCTLAESTIELTVSVDVTNLGPGVVQPPYVGGLYLVNTATDTAIGGAVNFPHIAPSETSTITITRTVPIADIIAGNIATLIQVESHQLELSKSWELSNFALSYDLESTESYLCSDEFVFDLSIC